ncbi:hypothetical protein PR248_00775, partial [Metamycoplasma hyosynoviae]
MVNATLAISVISIPIFTKTFSNKDRHNIRFSELSKIVEVSKNNKNQDYYVSKNAFVNKNKFYVSFDLVNAFYFSSI